MDFATYITGFTDGEGTFSVSFNKRKKLKTNVEVRPSFSISQNQRDLKILERIKDYFDTGGIRFSKRDYCYKYEVRSLKDLNDRVIPHFNKYPLQTAKAKDFEYFAKICKLMTLSYHKNPEKLLRIIDLAYMMNKSGKRRYKKSEILNLLTR